MTRLSCGAFGSFTAVLGEVGRCRGVIGLVGIHEPAASMDAHLPIPDVWRVFDALKFVRLLLFGLRHA